LVTRTEVLALESEAPEIAPGASASYRVLAVDPSGTLSPSDLSLSYCRSEKPLAEDRVVAAECTRASDHPLSVQGVEAQGAIPTAACALLGPRVPAMARPRDPDATGGYYQPVRIGLDGSVAVGLHRILCPLANAPIAIASEFRQRYVPNVNPVLLPLSAFANG